MIPAVSVGVKARLATIANAAHRAAAGRSRLMRLVSVAVSVLLAFGAIELATVQPSQAAGYVPIVGSGSTWVYTAMNNWMQDVKQFQITVNYSASGSTQGRNDFKSGVADFGASEIPYGVQDGTSYDPPPTRGYAYIPDAAGGTTFMYNLNINGQRVTNLRLSGAVIAGIFTNTITMWNAPQIKADNPGLNLPPTPIIPVVRSDGAGFTADFTQWMIATQGSYWTVYCGVVQRSPCTQTSSYPVQPGTAMRGVPQDAGVARDVSQAGSNGAIGYVEYSYALATGFPVAKVLNAAGYYTEPTPGHVAVSLLAAQLNTDQSSPRYLTEDLSQVYNDPDKRTYELSAYSYMIVPTDLNGNMTTAKGNTLGAFGQFVLCVGQSQVDPLGYSALPINLVERGFAQLRRIPGSQVPTTDISAIAQCHNPTFSTNGTNTLAANDPQPPATSRGRRSAPRQPAVRAPVAAQGRVAGRALVAAPVPAAGLAAGLGRVAVPAAAPGLAAGLGPAAAPGPAAGLGRAAVPAAAPGPVAAPARGRGLETPGLAPETPAPPALRAPQAAPPLPARLGAGRTVTRIPASALRPAVRRPGQGAPREPGPAVGRVLPPAERGPAVPAAR